MAKRVRAPRRGKSSKRRRVVKSRKYRRYRQLHTPLPKKLLLKQKYYTYIDLNPGIVTPAFHFFRANSIYDPDQTGVGHQPRGFDQIMPMYTHFTVIKSKITLYPVTEATVTGGVMYAVTLQDNYTGLTAGAGEGGTNICEYPKVKFSPLPSTYTHPFKKLKISYTPKKFLSISKPMSEDTLKGTQSTNPSEDVGFGCYCWAESSGDPGSVRFIVYLEYVSVLTEPKQPVES